MIRNVFIDLDNTIFDFNKAERIALSKTLMHMGVDPTEQILARYHILNMEQWEALERGEITLAQVKVRRFENLYKELGCSLSAEKTKQLYEQNLSYGHYYIEGAEAFLQWMHGKYRLYLITNGTTSVQKGRLKSAGIEGIFDSIFISEEIGLAKPAKEYFDYCFQGIEEFSKEESVIIGDSLTSDILGGIHAEVRTIWLNRTGKENNGRIIPDYEVQELLEIPAIIEGL
ncbi:MAG: noncanonical pyrimidine nucleotidase, YjjG family [Blautia sp.]|nr:noncanonical pyrimidine nucleotidase, YjjG family [Blautia sp.]